MMFAESYRKSLIAAISLHVVLFSILMVDPASKRPVLVNEVQNSLGDMTELNEAASPKKEIVRAQSIDTKQVQETVQRLQQEKAQQVKAENERQYKLKQQAEAAKQARLKEQQRLEKLKQEAAELAIAKKKHIEEEKKRLKELAQQKELETKRLQELKQKQEALKKKQAEEARLAAIKQKEHEAKEKAEKIVREKAELARQLAEKQAAQAAANRARIAGEVDKYKALIVNAIGRQWILPENVDKSLSSQFRIRLAPDGAVMDVSLIRSSGDRILDRSAESAIYKASPLPVPSDPATFDVFRDISLTVRPENVRG